MNQGTGFANEFWLEPAIGNTVNSIQLYWNGALRAKIAVQYYLLNPGYWLI